MELDVSFLFDNFFFITLAKGSEQKNDKNEENNVFIYENEQKNEENERKKRHFGNKLFMKKNMCLMGKWTPSNA